MGSTFRVLASVAAVVCHVGHVLAQERAAEDRSPVLKIGPAVERSLQDKNTILGGTVGIEATAIEDWLELELSATRLSSGGRRAKAIEPTFKKPFRLSSTTEMMLGLGPEVGRKFGGGATTKSKSIQFSVDFMFWPTKKLGWFVEPTYGYGVGPSRGERSLGASAGIVLAW